MCISQFRINKSFNLLVLYTFILIQFIHLNASICSVNLYTSSILMHLCTCLHLFVQVSAIPRTRCSYMRQAGSSRYHRFTHSHLWGNYGASFTLIHLWGIIYNYARIHLYTYTLMQHHIQCNKLKPQHSLVQCTLCM